MHQHHGHRLCAFDHKFPTFRMDLNADVISVIESLVSLTVFVTQAPAIHVWNVFFPLICSEIFFDLSSVYLAVVSGQLIFAQDTCKCKYICKHL